MRHANKYLAVFTLLALVSGPAMADPPAEKGKGNDKSVQQGNSAMQQGNPSMQQGDASMQQGGQSKQQGNKPDAQAAEHGNQGGANYRADDRDGNKHDDHDKSQNDANHGQVVSECNHRANERNMKGQDRKQWVEWCTDQGERFSYRNDHWTNDKTCYQKADNRNLSGDKRRAYVRDCLSRMDRTRYDYDERGEPRAKDVPGKGSK